MCPLTVEDLEHALNCTKRKRSQFTTKASGASTVPVQVEHHVHHDPTRFQGKRGKPCDGTALRVIKITTTFRPLPDTRAIVGNEPTFFATREAVVDAVEQKLLQSSKGRLSDKENKNFINDTCRKLWWLMRDRRWQSLGQNKRNKDHLREVKDLAKANKPSGRKGKREQEHIQKQILDMESTRDTLNHEVSALKSRIANRLGAKSSTMNVLTKIFNELLGGEEIRFLYLPRTLQPKEVVVATVEFKRSNQALNLFQIARTAATGRAKTSVPVYTHGNQDIIQDFTIPEGLRLAKLRTPETLGMDSSMVMRPKSSNWVEIGTGEMKARFWVDAERHHARIAKTRRTPGPAPQKRRKGLRLTLAPSPAIRVTLLALWLAMLLLQFVPGTSQGSPSSTTLGNSSWVTGWVMPAVAAIVAVAMAFHQEGLLTIHLGATAIVLVLVGFLTNIEFGDQYSPKWWALTAFVALMILMQLTYLAWESRPWRPKIQQ